MKAIVNTGPNRLELVELPVPQPGPGQVRIRTRAVGICATDLEMIAGWARTGFPAVPGHEWSGAIDAVGSGGNPAWIGRNCVAENVWADGGEVGFEHPGAYGEYFVTEQANVHLLPAGFPTTEAALLAPLAVCVRARNRAGTHLAGPVLIMGDGPIGLLMAAVVKNAGISDITLLGGREYRLAVARELGARRTLNYHGLKSDAATLGEFRTVVEASGSAAAMTAALGRAARGGTVLVLGYYGPGRADFPWNTILHREMHLIGSAASAGGWTEAVAMAVQGRVTLHSLVTHPMAADQFAEGVRLTRDRTANVIKVVLNWAEAR